MNILIGLVIAMFIITAGYVGYNVSQQEPMEEAGSHDIVIELETLNDEVSSIEIFQKLELDNVVFR